MKDRSVLVIAELEKGGVLSAGSLECLTAGRAVADSWGAKLNALMIGHNISSAAESLCFYGLDVVYTVDQEILRHFIPELYAETILQVYEKTLPELMIMGNTLQGSELAPRVGFALETGVITSCAGMELEQEELIFRKAVYSSNVVARYSLAAKPYIVTMASRANDAPKRNEERKGAINNLEITLDATKIKTHVLERESTVEEDLNLSAADIIVSGGRGIGGKEGFAELKKLAELLGGTVGASRPPCDLGWISSKAQVGQTGAIVAPSVYVAVGISGTMQHLAGMSSSKKIVAINKDPQANIFKVADYGIVGRYEEIIPALEKALLEANK